MRKSNGITLVALVVTIIILIILSVITINLIIGEDGILDKAKRTQQEYYASSIKEEIELGIVDVLSEVKKEDSIEQQIIEKLPNKLNETLIITDSLTGEYKNLKYWIDEKYKVHIGEKIEEIEEDMYLYKEGDECIELTGGWSTNYASITTVNTSNEKQVSVSSGNQKYGNYFTNNMIDLSEYNTIYIEATINKSNYYAGDFIISNSRETNVTTNNNFIKAYILDPALAYYEIDVSDLNEEYYLGFIFSNRTITIKNVYISKNKTKRVDLINNNTEVVPWQVYGQTTKNINQIGITATTVPANSKGNYMTSSKIDLTNYTKVCFIGGINSVNTAAGHMFVSSSNEAQNPSDDGVVGYVQLKAGEYYHEIDISNLEGEYYIGLLSSNRTISIYDLWIE